MSKSHHHHGSDDGGCTGGPAAADGPALRLRDLAPAERMLVRAVRVWAATGEDAEALVATMEETLPGAPAGGAQAPLRALLEALDDPAGPDVSLRPLPCGRLTGSEWALVTLMAAMHAGDAATAHASAAALVGPGRTRRVMADAFVLAGVLAGAVVRPRASTGSEATAGAAAC